MARTWGISIDEKERMELERIVMDGDAGSAIDFLKRVVYSKVKESEKPGSCFHDAGKPVEEVPRPIKKHKGLGTFDS